MASGARGSSLVRRLYEGALDMLLRKEVVGADKHGNTYMRWVERVAGQEVERREVRWAKPYMLYTPHDVPPDWRMWLRKLRDKPPTPEEVAATEAQSSALQQRVVRLEEQEALRRTRQAAQGAHAQRPGSAPPDMSRMLRQMRDEGTEARAGGRRAPSSGAGEFKPDTWKPGS